MRWAILLGAGLLAGCVGMGYRERTKQAFVGKHVDRLAIELGPPTAVMKLSDGGSVHEYESPGGFESRGPGTVARVNCKTRFLVDPRGIVRNVKVSGGSCPW